MRTNIIDPPTTRIDAAAMAADHRRSIRLYESTPIPQADLTELLRLAARAPSAFNAQPWRFVVVQDPALKAALSAAAYGQQQILRAPATIVLYSDMVDALDRMPDSMHPDLPQDKRDAGVESFRATFANQSEAERCVWQRSARPPHLYIMYTVYICRLQKIAKNRRCFTCGSSSRWLTALMISGSSIGSRRGPEPFAGCWALPLAKSRRRPRATESPGSDYVRV